MGLDAYMVFTPTNSSQQTNSTIYITGESADALGLDSSKNSLGAFEIIDFKWGVSSTKEEKVKEEKPDGTIVKKTIKSSGSDQHRVVNVPSFKISKPFDSASPGLFLACLDTQCVFTQASVMFRKSMPDDSSNSSSSGSSPVNAFVWLKFVFGNVRVDSVEWGIKGVDQGDAKPEQEDVSFSFESCDIFYSQQTAAGLKATAWGGTKKSASYTRPSSSSSSSSSGGS